MEDGDGLAQLVGNAKHEADEGSIAVVPMAALAEGLHCAITQAEVLSHLTHTDGCAIRVAWRRFAPPTDSLDDCPSAHERERR